MYVRSATTVWAATATTAQIAGFTLSSTNRCLLASCVTEGEQALTDCQVNSVSMSDPGLFQSGQTFYGIDTWYALEAALPSNGDYNIDFTVGTSTDMLVGAMLHDSIKDQAPEATSAQNPSGTSYASSDVNTVTDDAEYIAMIGYRETTTHTVDGDGTERFEGDGGTGHNTLVGVSGVAGAAPQAISMDGTWGISKSGGTVVNLLIFEKDAGGGGGGDTPLSARGILSLR